MKEAYYQGLLMTEKIQLSYLDKNLTNFQKGKLDSIVMHFFIDESLNEESIFYQIKVSLDNDCENPVLYFDKNENSKNLDIDFIAVEAQEIVEILEQSFASCNFDISMFFLDEHKEKVAMKILNKKSIKQNKNKHNFRKF